MNKTPLTAAIVRELLTYDPSTGHFYWNEAGQGRNSVGIPAGGPSDQGYWMVSILGNKHVRAHRLAWLYVNGEWPTQYIDHINGDRMDNRIENLRDVPKSINQQNITKPRSHNSSGYLGVSKANGGQGWSAVIRLNGKTHYLGYFKDPKLAHERYVAAKRALHDGNTL